MTLTRQHFSLIAKTIKGLYLDGDESLREHIANTFANELSATNSNFDRAKFLEACGIK